MHPIFFLSPLQDPWAGGRGQTGEPNLLRNFSANKEGENAISSLSLTAETVGSVYFSFPPPFVRPLREGRVASFLEFPPPTSTSRPFSARAPGGHLPPGGGGASGRRSRRPWPRDNPPAPPEDLQLRNNFFSRTSAQSELLSLSEIHSLLVVCGRGADAVR